MYRPEFQPKLATTNVPLHFKPTTKTYAFLKDGFKFHTILLIGAFSQVILSLILPLRWAIVPPVVLLLNSIITTVIQGRNPLSNEFKTHVVHGRASAQIPSVETAATGHFNSNPAEAPIVVFNIGSQFNHPLGPLAPGVKEMGAFFIKMKQDLIDRREELGLLNVSSWRGDERGSHNTSILTIFFRDVEGLHRFAHEPLHRQAWDWLNAHKSYEHIGVFHETYIVPAKSYETVYLNCRPILLGGSAVKLGKEGEQPRWANALVNANTPALKTQYSRMARDDQGRIPEQEDV
ncbi:hypothetical protein B0T10DRAFT_458018 [Thelonectria olida]|uniref:Uncharacterized protein n=1 Tax=Thelonectria olida TaxID=1576542 RepID=A0A9P9AU71_9HYPO|nr:hypothetical protein B0T10DRAFT_458018 [Thelonectria olida]